MTSPLHGSFDCVALAIGDYLEVLADPPDSRDERIIRLIEALDGLVAAYHATEEVEPSADDFEYPTIESRGGPTRPSTSFQDLALYPSVEPDEGPDQEVSLHDPFDDLSEIADDMKLVMWLADNVGENDAVWEFRFGFFTHWGRHLFSVRYFLQTHLTWPDAPHSLTPRSSACAG